MTAALTRNWRDLYTGPVEPDGEYYTHPATQRRYVRVSTALETKAKQGLPPWAAGLAAEAAFAELPRVVAASRRRPCERTYNRCDHDWQTKCDRCPCGECRACVQKALTNKHWTEKKRRADEGTAVHNAIEHWVLHNGIWPADFDPQLEPYRKAFEDFVRDYGLTPDSWEMAEATILNHTEGYGGTLDGQVRFAWGVTELANDFCARLGKVGQDVRVTLDAKSREDEGTRLYVEHSLQLAAYRHAEVLLMRDGTEYPLPPTDGAAILQLRPDGYALRPVVADERTYRAFLTLLSFWRWLDEFGDTAIAARSFLLPEDYKRDKANRKAREKRAAAKNNGHTTTTGASAAAKKPAKTTTARRPASAAKTAVKERPLSERVLGIPPAHPDSPYDDPIPF
jgi:hypothetical protein